MPRPTGCATPVGRASTGSERASRRTRQPEAWPTAERPGRIGALPCCQHRPRGAASPDRKCRWRSPRRCPRHRGLRPRTRSNADRGRRACRPCRRAAAPARFRHPVDAVGGDLRKRHLCLKRPLDHGQRQLQPGGDGDRLRDIRGPHPGGIPCPGLRQVQPMADEGVAPIQDKGGKHPNQ